MKYKAGDIIKTFNGAIIVVHHCGDHLEAQFLVGNKGKYVTTAPSGDSEYISTVPQDV